MSTSTTLTIPASYTVVAQFFPTSTNTSASAILSTFSATATPSPLTLAQGFVLYVPLVASKNAPDITLAAAYNALSFNSSPTTSASTTSGLLSGSTGTAITAYAVYGTNPISTDTINPASTSVFPLKPGTSLLIPYTRSLPQNVDIAEVTSGFSALLTNGDIGVSSTISIASTATSQSSIAGSSTDAATGTSIPTTDIPPGALAGGVAGAAIAGILIGALIAWCCLRRRNKKAYNMQASSKHTLSRKPVAGTGSTEMNDIAVDSVTDLSGWRKHLPQEADDNTIGRAVGELFDLIQMYVDEYYGRQSRGTPTDAIKAIATLVPDATDVVEALKRTDSVGFLLQAVLARWIVHRISLYSDNKSSLLPEAYTHVPKNNNWHMESLNREQCLVVENKPAFLPAFSQWRVLNGYLGPKIANDRGIPKELKAKIDQAVASLTAALFFWESPPRNKNDRIQYLQDMLQRASRTGSLLFVQPSTFMFDWTKPAGAQSGTVVIYPVLRRTSNELGKPVAYDKVLTGGLVR